MLFKSNSSYGTWLVKYQGKYTTESKYFWSKKEALDFIATL